MSQLIFEVRKADALASVQDIGRRQSVHHGVTQGGAMDLNAAYWANRLLGRTNSRAMNSVVIEITLGLFEIMFHCDCDIAITGADLNANLNGRSINIGQTFRISDGDILKFISPINGLRAYLAIKAELDLNSSFNSVSTVTREKIGGFEGRAFKKGDRIFGGTHIGEVMSAIPERYLPDYNKPLSVDVIPSYQFNDFPKVAIKQFLASSYQISTSSNRMAYRFVGEPITHDIGALASEGIAYGAIQIPPDGQPVILLNDRQTMGGYPKIGCVTKLSGAALSQRFSPTKIKFRLVNVNEARRDYLEFLRFFEE